VSCRGGRKFLGEALKEGGEAGPSLQRGVIIAWRKDSLGCSCLAIAGKTREKGMIKGKLEGVVICWSGL